MKNPSLNKRISRITDTAPSDCSISTYSSIDFVNSTVKFLNDNFRGLIEVSVQHNPLGYVEVSPRGFAHFLKLLLREVYARCEISAAIKCGKNEIEVIIDCGSFEIDTHKIITIAEASGFVRRESDDRSKIILYTNVKQRSYVMVYAQSTTALEAYLYEVFFF